MAEFEGKFGSNRKPGTVIEGNFGSNRTKKAKAKVEKSTTSKTTKKKVIKKGDK